MIDALERDLEDDVGSGVQPAVEDVHEVTPQVDKQDIPVGAMVRPRPRSIESPDRSCALSASRACASATMEGRVAIFADRGVKRLRVIPRGSVAISDTLENEGVVPSSPGTRRHQVLSAGETQIDHPSEFPEDDRGPHVRHSECGFKSFKS